MNDLDDDAALALLLAAFPGAQLICVTTRPDKQPNERTEDPMKDEWLCQYDPSHKRTIGVEEDVADDRASVAQIILEEPDGPADTGLTVYGPPYDDDDDDEGPVVVLVCFDCFIEDHPEIAWGAITEELLR